METARKMRGCLWFTSKCSLMTRLRIISYRFISFHFVSFSYMLDGFENEVRTNCGILRKVHVHGKYEDFFVSPWRSIEEVRSASFSYMAGERLLGKWRVHALSALETN